MCTGRFGHRSPVTARQCRKNRRQQASVRRPGSRFPPRYSRAVTSGFATASPHGPGMRDRESGRGRAGSSPTGRPSRRGWWRAISTGGSAWGGAQGRDRGAPADGSRAAQHCLRIAMGDRSRLPGGGYASSAAIAPPMPPTEPRSTPWPRRRRTRGPLRFGPGGAAIGGSGRARPPGRSSGRFRDTALP